MYPVSELYKSKIKELERTFSVSIQIQHSLGVLDLTDADIVAGSLIYNESSQAGEDFTIGGTVASDIQFSILNKPEYANYDFVGATLTVNIGLEVEKKPAESFFYGPHPMDHEFEGMEGAPYPSAPGIYEYVPLGIFNIDEVGKQRNTIKLKGIDNMIKFDKPYSLSNLGYPATLLQIYVDACNVCDVMPAMGSFTNSDSVVQERPDGDLTFRDIIGYIAELSGSFARMNRAGALEFAWYLDSGVTLTGANRFNFIPRDDLVQIKGVMATVDGTTYLAGTDEYVVDLTENPLLQGGHETMLSSIYNKIKDTAFYPYESGWQGNPAIQAGDIITQIDRVGKEWPTLVTSSTYKYRGASKLSAKGLPVIAKGFKGSTNKKIDNIVRKVEKDFGNKLTTLEQAQLHNTELIANMLGGYVIEEEGALYIADNPDLNLAAKVWKWGLGGFGYSSTGKDGPYTTSISADGSIVAMLVAANIITADMVQTGELRSVDGSTRINLDDGTFNFKDVLKWENEKLRIASPDINPLGIVNDEHITAYFPFDDSIAATDGLQPTFARASEAYLPDGTKVSAGQPRFVDGKFGKGVLVEEGTENLFTANGGINLTDISYYNSTTEPTYNVLTEKYAGVNILRVNLGQGGSRYFAQAGLSVGTTYTFSILVRPTNRSMSLWLQTNEGTGTVTLCPVGKFTKLYLTFTPEASYRWLIVGSWQANDIIDFTAPQLETKSYATSFTDNTRDKEWLTIPTSIIDKDEGTIDIWLKSPIITEWNNFFSMLGLSNGRFLLYYTAAGSIIWDYGPGNKGIVSPSITAKPNEWIQITMRWSASAGTRELFVNGNLIGSKEFTPPDSLPAGNVAIVDNYSAVVDDLRISSIARTDEEIKAYYESAKPFFDTDTYVKTNKKYNNVEISPTIGVKATHSTTGEYTQLNADGLKRFVPIPVYKEVPTGVPNFEGFEGGTLPEGWEMFGSRVGVISTDKRTGTYCLNFENYNITPFARTIQNITKDCQASFWYKSLASGNFILDGVKHALPSTNGVWTQFTVNVTKGFHVFQWESGYLKDAAYALRLDDITFEQNPVQYVIDGYTKEGYDYNFRTYVGSAATYGKYWKRQDIETLDFNGDATSIPDIWIQLPDDFKGKNFDVILSFKNIDTTASSWAGIGKLELEVLEVDYVNAGFKVRARAHSFQNYYFMWSLYSGMEPELKEGEYYVWAGFNFIYIASY